MSDLSKEELDHLYEASKIDHNCVVGSEVRQMVGMIRRSAARIEWLEWRLREITEAHSIDGANAIARAALSPEQNR